MQIALRKKRVLQIGISFGLFLTAFFLLFQSSLLAEEDGSAKGSPVEVKQNLVYDRAALKEAVNGAEEEDGKKSASLYGKVVFNYSNGVVEEKGAFFKQSLEKGRYSEVSVELFDNSVFLGNNLWMMIAAFLVFIMHLGFAMVESGLTQAKNTVNILFKNTTIIAIGLLSYALIGFNLMYPGDWNIVPKVLGFAGFGISAGETDLSPA